MLYGADGMARIGDFDGYHFVESGTYNPLDYGNSTYAGQTWSHHPEDKRIHISWVRGMGGVGEDLGYEDMPFSQCMTIPAEITLRRLNGGLHICRTPVAQVSALFGKICARDAFTQTAETALPMHNPAHYGISVTDMKDTVSIRTGENTTHYDAKAGILSFKNGHSVQCSGTDLHFDVYMDTTTVEFCFEDTIMATYAMAPAYMSLILKGECRVDYTCHRMENIWELSAQSL